jgi:hypothetical protein
MITDEQKGDLIWLIEFWGNQTVGGLRARRVLLQGGVRVCQPQGAQGSLAAGS